MRISLLDILKSILTGFACSAMILAAFTISLVVMIGLLLIFPWLAIGRDPTVMFIIMFAYVLTPVAMVLTGAITVRYVANKESSSYLDAAVLAAAAGLAAPTVIVALALACGMNIPFFDIRFILTMAACMAMSVAGGLAYKYFRYQRYRRRNFSARSAPAW